jgi:copper homeostasis protein
MALLEIIAYDIEGCVLAERNGADRIELCTDPHLGGTTPTLSLLKEAVELVKIPIHVMIRPRGGDFNYTEEEFYRMLECIPAIRDLGAAGVVFGVLNSDYTFDVYRNRLLMNQCKNLNVTFHRAFDELAHPYTSLRKIIDLGFNRILTSGQQDTAIEAAEFLSELVSEAANAITIMPGSGITSRNIAMLDHIIGAREYHTSAKKVDGQGNYIGVDENEVKAIKTQLL